MSKGIFISATGTDVGKTFVTALIVKNLREHGCNAGYYKAALSGAERIDGQLVPGDAKYVCDVAGIPDSPAGLVTYVYETAVSPHLAAQIEKVPVELGVIDSHVNLLKSRFDFITFEGSGGIICPLRRDGQTIMLADIIRRFGLGVLLVADAGLGTINSTVLTVEYASIHEIAIKGIILNRFEKGHFLHEDNQRQIELLTGIPVIARVPPQATALDLSPQALMRFYKDF